MDYVRAIMPDADVEIDVEAGQQMTFRLADGSVAPAYSLAWLAAPMAICTLSIFAIGAAQVPILLSVRALKAVKAVIDFYTDVISYTCADLSACTFVMERRLQTGPKGHLLWNSADAVTGRVPVKE